MGRNIIEVIIKADNQASAKLKGVAADVKNVEASLNATGAAIAVVGAAIITALAGVIFKTAQWADNMRDLANTFGVSTEFLSRLDHVARKNGASIEELAVGLKLLSKNALEQGSATDKGKNALTELGLSARTSFGALKPVEQILFEVADAIAKIPDPMERAARMTEIFGRSGSRLTNTFSGGSQALREYMNEADKLGGVLRADVAGGADALMDSLEDVKTASKGVGLALLEAFGPSTVTALTNVANAIAEIHDVFGKLDKTMSDSAPPSWWKAMFSVTPAGPKALQDVLKGVHENLVDTAEDGDAAAAAWDKVKGTVATAIPVSAIDRLKEISKMFPAAPSPIEMSLLSCATATELWDAKTMDLAGHIVAVTGAYEKVAVPAMVNPLADSWQAGLDEFDIKGMDVARDLTQEFGGMFSQIAQKGVNAAEVFDSAWRSAIGSVAAKLAEMAIWKVGGSLLGGGLIGGIIGGIGSLLGFNAGGEVKGAASGMEAFGGTRGRDTIPTMIGSGEVVMPSPTVNRLKAFLDRAEGSLQGAVNVYPLFFSGSRQDSQLAAEYIQRRLDGNSRFVIEGSL